MADDTNQGDGVDVPQEHKIVSSEEFKRRMDEKLARKNAAPNAHAAQNGSDFFDKDFLRALIKSHGILLDIFAMQTSFIVRFANSEERKEHDANFLPLAKEYTQALEECNKHPK